MGKRDKTRRPYNLDTLKEKCGSMIRGKSHSIKRRVTQSKREVFYTGYGNKYLSSRQKFIVKMIDKKGRERNIERKYNEDVRHESIVQQMINKEWKYKHLQFPFLNEAKK